MLAHHLLGEAVQFQIQGRSRDLPGPVALAIRETGRAGQDEVDEMRGLEGPARGGQVKRFEGGALPFGPGQPAMLELLA